MRSVIIYFKDTCESKVSAYIQKMYPHQFGPPWVRLSDGEPCLYINFYKSLNDEFETDERAALVQALGSEPSVCVIADISGRQNGKTEVYEWVLNALNEFDGIASDDYSDHFWTRDEIETGRTIMGQQFFESKNLR